MAKRPTNAGDDVEARCTRCREVTNHTVVAMVESRVARVQCNICNGIHNYYPPATQRTAARPAAAKPEKPVKAPRATARRTQAAEQAEWEEATRSAAAGKAVVPYTMTRSCRAGELLQHPSFGIGVVKAIIPPGKMTVLFEAGTKLMRCG